MTGFSPSEAALSGFATLRQHWRLVVGWSVFNLMALMILVIVATILIFIFAATAGSRDAASTAGGVVGGVAGGLGTLAVEAVLVAALYRTLLSPPQPGFLNLRLGKSEGFLVLGWLLVWMACGAVIVAAVLAGAALADFGAPGVVAVVVVTILAVGYLLLRFSLAAPVAVAERKLGLAASWRLTRGRIAPLLGMVLLALCLFAMVALGGWLVLLGVTGALFGFENAFAMSDAEALKDAPGPALFQIAAQLLFAPVLWTILQSPLAAAYQAFTTPD